MVPQGPLAMPRKPRDQALVATLLLRIGQPQDVFPDLDEAHHGGVQGLERAVLPEEVLVPHGEGAGLVLHVAVRDEHQRRQHVADLSGVHVAAAERVRVHEVGAGVDQDGADVLGGVVAEAQEPERAEQQLHGGAVDVRELGELQERREQVHVVGAVRVPDVGSDEVAQADLPPVQILLGVPRARLVLVAVAAGVRGAAHAVHRAPVIPDARGGRCRCRAVSPLASVCADLGRLDAASARGGSGRDVHLLAVPVPHHHPEATAERHRLVYALVAQAAATRRLLRREAQRGRGQTQGVP
mmetsp:Transcript_9689/g.28658  ORF Transcript_9689/g.28658 Transcript_9689/m.28658 type:complete len:298 (+) Transcript_9689:472-1365(+)